MSKRFLTILYLCISSLLGVFCFLNLEFEPNYSSFGLSDDSFHKEYNELDSKFDHEIDTEQYILVLEREAGWMNYEDFKLIDEITQELATMSMFQSVSSLTNILVPKKGILGYSEVPLFNVNSESSYLKTRNTINSLNDIACKFIDQESNVVLIYCTPTEENVSFPKNYLQQLSSEGVDFSIIDLTEDNQRSDTILSETVSIALLVLTVILITFYLFTKSFLGLILSLGFIGCNLGLTFLVQYILRIPFSIGMVSVPSLVIILSFSDLMHVLFLQSIYSKKCKSDEEIKSKIKDKIKVPMFLTSVTNLTGFIIILALSKTSGLSELAFVSLIGVVIAYLNSRFILISLLKRRHNYLNPIKIRGINERMTIKIAPFRKGVILFSVLISIFLSVLLIRNYEVGFSIENYKSSKHHIDDKRAELANLFFGNKSVEVVIEYDKGVDIWSYQSQVQCEMAEKLIQRTFQTKYVSSVNNLVRRYNYIESFSHEKAYKLRKSLKSPDIIKHIERLGGKGLISKDGQMSKISFGFTSIDLKSDLEKYEELEDGLGKISSKGLKFRLMSKTVESDRAIAYYSIRILLGLMLGIFCSALIMMIVKKSMLLGLGTLVVNLIPVLLSAYMMIYLKIQINPQSLFLLSILMGVCLDDSIYLSGYIKSNRNNLVIFPLLVTSVVLGLGFLALFFSSYPWISDFSIIFSVGVLCAFLLDMFVYPLFMKTDQSE